jgi:hypothetical protein
MTTEELKSKISFTTRNLDRNGLVEIRGELLMSCSMRINQWEYPSAKAGSAIVDDVKERIRLTILRFIYDDQRKALMEAVEQFMCANPMDFRAIDTARNNILKAAQYQPSWSEKV